MSPGFEFISSFYSVQGISKKVAHAVGDNCQTFVPKTGV